MNQQEAQISLRRYLGVRTSYPVIALKGQWGGGKTHVWKNVEKSLSSASGLGPLYVSLFGIASIQDAKDKLYAAHFSPRFRKFASAIGAVARPVSKLGPGLGRFNKTAGAVIDTASAVAEEVGTRMVESILYDRVIVLDDLERCEPTLSIVSILGFIEYLRDRRCHVLAIYNEERIEGEDSVKALSTYREKVFDVELKLETSPEEAFDIAVGKDTKPPHLEMLRASCIELGVSNIRVARRVVNAAKHIFSHCNNLDDELVSDAVPAIAATTASFYQAVKSTPNFDAVVTQILGPSGATSSSDSDTKPTSDVALQASREFVKRYIRGAGAGLFPILREHLETGNLLENKFENYWKKAQTQVAQYRLKNEIEDWLYDIDYHPRFTNDQLVSRAEKFLLSLNDIEEPSRRLIARELKDLGREDLARHLKGNAEDGGARAVTREMQLATLQAKVDEIAQTRAPVGGNWRGVLERAPVDQFVELIERADARQFYSFGAFLHNLINGNVRFEGRQLANALRQVVSGQHGERTIAVLRKIGRAGEAVDLLLKLADGELSGDWPNPVLAPQ